MCKAPFPKFSQSKAT